MNKYYARAYRAERAILHQLEQAGYTCLRTAGSHGVCDVVAIGKNDVKLVEIKCPDKFENIKKSEDERPLRAIRVPSNVSREVWYKIPGDGLRRVIF